MPSTPIENMSSLRAVNQSHNLYGIDMPAVASPPSPSSKARILEQFEQDG